MTVQASFYRPGVAYLYDNGAQVADGIPRFTTGKFAGTRALRIEEGTANLLTANQSDVETDTTGFTPIGGATAVRGTTISFSGNAALRLTFNNTTSSGVQIIATTNVQGTYIGRLRTSIATGTIITNSLQYFLRINYTDATFDENVMVVTPNVQWADRITDPVPSNPGKTVSFVSLIVRQVGTLLNGNELWIDTLQIERQTEATTWHIGGGTRQSEKVLVPTSTLLDSAAGTVEAWVRVETLVEAHIILDTRQIDLGNTGRFIFRINAFGGELTFSYWNGSTFRVLSGGNLVAKTWTHVAASWGPTGGKIYFNGALTSSNADAPVLSHPPRMSLGGRVTDANETASGILLGGMRFTRGRARSNAEVLAAYNANIQFTEDGTDSTVFSFNGTTRSLLPATHRIIHESMFLVPVAVTASSSAVNYSALNIADWEFPLLSHRTAGVALTTLTFDFGAVVNFRAIFVALVNWEGAFLATSFDNSTYVEDVSSPFICDVDPADQYRKWGVEMNISGRYARITIPVQATDNNDPYFETPLVIFASDCNAFTTNSNWGMRFNVTYPYQQNSAGAHDEMQAQGKQFLTMEVQSTPPRGANSTEWQQLAALGNHQKFVLFTNLGNSAECYLMRSDGNVTWEEQSGYNAFSMTWQEHIN